MSRPPLWMFCIHPRPVVIGGWTVCPRCGARVDRHAP